MTGQGRAEVSKPEQSLKGAERQGQGRQRSVIQVNVTRYRTAGRLRAGRMVKTGKTRKHGLDKNRSMGKPLLGLMRQDELATDNTGINTLGIRGNMDDT
jgi:hypothetical protein